MRLKDILLAPTADKSKSRYLAEEGVFYENGGEGNGVACGRAGDRPLQGARRLRRGKLHGQQQEPCPKERYRLTHLRDFFLAPDD